MCLQKECPTKFETRWLQEIPFSKELTDNYCALWLIFESKLVIIIIIILLALKSIKSNNISKMKTIFKIDQIFITLHYRHFKRHLHLKWPVVHQQLHVIRNTAHRPSTQASYSASRVRPGRKISCAVAQIAATLTISISISGCNQLINWSRS